jgi:predicted transcriptional regulator
MSATRCARLLHRCGIEGCTQQQAAEEVCISAAAVSQNLAAARDLLLDLYGGLRLAEQLEQANAG